MTYEKLAGWEASFDIPCHGWGTMSVHCGSNRESKSLNASGAGPRSQPEPAVLPAWGDSKNDPKGTPDASLRDEERSSSRVDWSPGALRILPQEEPPEDVVVYEQPTQMFNAGFGSSLCQA